MIKLFIPGIPAPGGSKTGFYNKKLKRVLMTPASKKTKPWMDTVRGFALEQYQGEPLLGAISCDMVFVMPRPNCDYKTKKGQRTNELKNSAPMCHTKKPDLTKLIRSTEDALTGICWRDDSQVFRHKAVKTYPDSCLVPDRGTGVHIIIEEISR